MTKYDKSRSWAAMYDYEVRIHIRISLLICLISYNRAFNLSEDATAENKIIRRATQVLMTRELTIEACNKALKTLSLLSTMGLGDYGIKLSPRLSLQMAFRFQCTFVAKWWKWKENFKHINQSMCKEHNLNWRNSSFNCALKLVSFVKTHNEVMRLHTM